MPHKTDSCSIKSSFILNEICLSSTAPCPYLFPGIRTFKTGRQIKHPKEGGLTQNGPTTTLENSIAPYGRSSGLSFPPVLPRFTTPGGHTDLLHPPSANPPMSSLNHQHRSQPGRGSLAAVSQWAFPSSGSLPHHNISYDFDLRDRRKVT